MFNKSIPLFKDFIKESLTVTYWRNYETDAPVFTDKETNDVSNQIINLFGVKNQKELMFTSNDVGFGTDYLFFYDIVKSLNAEEQVTLNLPGYIVYINYYIDPKTDKPITLVNSKLNDGSMTSYIFIKSEDFKTFDPDANDSTNESGDEESEDGGKEGAQGGEPKGDGGGLGI